MAGSLFGLIDRLVDDASVIFWGVPRDPRRRSLAGVDWSPRVGEKEIQARRGVGMVVTGEVPDRRVRGLTGK